MNDPILPPNYEAFVSMKSESLQKLEFDTFILNNSDGTTTKQYDLIGEIYQAPRLSNFDFLENQIYEIAETQSGSILLLSLRKDDYGSIYY
jgi:hypothetical protein